LYRFSLVILDTTQQILYNMLVRVFSNFRFAICDLRLREFLNHKNHKSAIGNRQFCRAFTILEIVLLLAIVGIFISGIIPLYLNVVTVNKSAQYYSTAYKVLDSKIEEYRNTSFDSVNSGTFSITELPSGQGALTVSNNIDGAPQADIKRLDLTITWNFKKTNQVNITTYIARNGLKR